MLSIKPYEIWFVTGSQHLYGPETLIEVENNSKKIVESINNSLNFSLKIVFKKLVTTSEEILDVCSEANTNKNCAGIITWMHTFSPAKMWIHGLNILNKPLLHLHTQFNREIPWNSIDMDFMNTNQSAHGDREYGFIGARMDVKRKIVVGFYEDQDVIDSIESWGNTAVAYNECNDLKIARFADNMRNVAVTEGDKVEAQIKFGWRIDGYGIGDLVDIVDSISEEEVNRVMKEYQDEYDFAEDIKEGTEKYESVRYQAKIEAALEKFLIQGGFSAFTTNFEALHGLKQLPGLAVQHLMSKGYGFGGEGDWKTAALTRVMKIMADNKDTSFMEDYTYHLEKGHEKILGAHMLEVCPTIASLKPKIEVHPLGIGNKEDPARLTFNGKPGKGICATLIDMGNRFRLIVNDVESTLINEDMPNLPVARVLWTPKPSLKEAAHAWILAGGAHHTVYSTKVTFEQLEDLAEMFDIECVRINEDTNISSFKKELKWNSIFYKLR